MKLHTVKSRAHGKLAFSGSVPNEIIFIYQKRKVELQQKYLLHTSSLNKQEREEHKNTINLNIWLMVLFRLLSMVLEMMFNLDADLSVICHYDRCE